MIAIILRNMVAIILYNMVALVLYNVSKRLLNYVFFALLLIPECDGYTSYFELGSHLFLSRL